MSKKAPLLGLLLSIGFLGWALLRLDLGAVARTLLAVERGPLMGGLALFAVAFWLRALRWQAMLGPIKRVGAGRSLAILLVGYMANALLPARLGEVVRAYVLKRQENIPTATGLATVALERVLDGLTLLGFLGALLAANSLGFAPLPGPRPAWLGQLMTVGSLGFAGAFAAGALLVFSQTVRALAKRLVARIAPAALASKFEALFDALVAGGAALKRPRSLLAILCLSLVIWGLEGYVYQAFGRSLHLELPVYAALMVVIVINLGCIIPSAPGNVGTFQFFAMLGLGLFGVSRDVGFAYGVLLNGTFSLAVVAGGLGGLVFENLEWKSLVTRPIEPEPVRPSV